ncbi:helix-turn-helix transcriptional regulator (plasmid) [Pseudomonas yamanorum]|nr:helix-turn-helix transcriptional regulator [Pseudomonas yamanorum]
MSPNMPTVALHQDVAIVLEELDQPHFWRALTTHLRGYVPVDNWVALIFSDGAPRILDFAEAALVGYEPDPLISAYATGLYLLDPFYIANRENSRSGFFHLQDIAPEHFLQTEYYKRYFATYVFEDEVQYNLPLDGERTLGLSLGSRVKFSPEHIELLKLFRPWIVALMRQRMFFEETSRAVSATVPLTWQENMATAVKSLGTSLTARELDVFRLVLSGCSNKEVAEKLVLSAETVKVHRRNFYAKLNIKSQTELFALFLRSQTANIGLPQSL